MKTSTRHAIKRCLTSEDGKELLEYLSTVNFVTHSLLSSEPIMMAYREGRRSVVLELIRLIETNTHTNEEV